MLELKKLVEFRQAVYNQFSKRRDANMNLLDALSSYGHRCQSVIELSESPYFERKYSSVTDAIADGLSEVNWSKMAKTIYDNAVDKNAERIVFITDTTPQPRQSAKCVEDRHITYSPNPAPGNKPITVGHEYSALSLLPLNSAAQEKHWLVPVDTRRVKSHEKGNEVGMLQVSECIKNLNLEATLTISVADSKYGTENCRKQVALHSNWVHIFRLNSTRNVYAKPDAASAKQYGLPMKLNDESTHTASDSIQEKTIITRSGKSYLLKIKAWYNQILRGSRQFKGYQHPLTVMQLTAVDANGKSLYKNPLWLGLVGERRDEITLLEAYHYYDSRYDIEHYFRFGKDKLLFDKYQTPEVEHEQTWWQLTALAYSQLYLAREQVPLLPKPWERYLPSFQAQHDQTPVTATPSQTQRGFSTLLDTIGTPAKHCRPRGKPKGRVKGETQPRRPNYKVIFKSSNTKKNTPKKSLQESEKNSKNSDYANIEELLKTVKNSLQNIQVTPEKFCELLQNQI